MSVVVPAPAVLMDQPSGGVSLGAGLTCGHIGGLHGRCHHDQPLAVVRQQLSDGAQHRGLAHPGGTLDHHERSVACEGVDGAVVDGVSRLRVKAVGTSHGGGVHGASCDPVDEVVFDGKDVRRGEGSDVFGYIAPGQKRDTTRHGP